MPKVLVVDDSDTLRAQLTKTLVGAGIEIVEAADGVLGLSAFTSDPDIKLVISDVNMPNMDGLTMCSKLVELPNGKTTPIIMLTTESNADMKEKGKAIGVKAWVTKPYQDDKLIMAVKKLLGI
ncbi:MAG: response regulator [Pseudobdellovibrionaceae bacterium]